MSWECRYKSDGMCNKLEVPCDPGRKGCVLRGKVYFPFAPEKNPSFMNDQEPAKPRGREEKPRPDSR